MAIHRCYRSGYCPIVSCILGKLTLLGACRTRGIGDIPRELARGLKKEIQRLISTTDNVDGIYAYSEWRSNLERLLGYICQVGENSAGIYL